MNERLVGQMLNRMGIDSPTWRTLVVVSSVATQEDPTHIWNTWADLDNWTLMSPLVTTIRWTTGDPWRPGSEFVETLTLGFPLGHETTKRVVSVDPGRSAEWGYARRGLRAGHLWRLEPGTPSGLRLTTVAVFHGSSIGLSKPFVATRWTRLFQAQLDGLLDLAITNQGDLVAPRREPRAKQRGER